MPKIVGNDTIIGGMTMKRFFKYISCFVIPIVAFFSMGCARPGERAAEEYVKKDLVSDPSYTKVRYELFKHSNIGKLVCKTVNKDKREVVHFYYFDILDNNEVAYIPVQDIPSRVLSMMETLDNAGFKKDTQYYYKVSKLHRAIEDDTWALIRGCEDFSKQEAQDVTQVQSFQQAAQDINKRVDECRELQKEAPKYLQFEYVIRQVPGYVVLHVQEEDDARVQVVAYTVDKK